MSCKENTADENSGRHYSSSILQLRCQKIFDGANLSKNMVQPEINDDKPRSKVARVIESYHLDDLGQELEDRWLATDERGMSTRELADHFNKRVLTATIENSGMNALDVDIGLLYKRLTYDEISSGVQTRVQRRLDSNGIDVDQLIDDFVSHQAIHTYLREFRDVQQRKKPPEERKEDTVERIQKLQDRTSAVTEDALESLQAQDLVPQGELDVLVDIQVAYGEEDKQDNVFSFLREG